MSSDILTVYTLNENCLEKFLNGEDLALTRALDLVDGTVTQVFMNVRAKRKRYLPIRTAILTMGGTLFIQKFKEKHTFWPILIPLHTLLDIFRILFTSTSAALGNVEKDLTPIVLAECVKTAVELSDNWVGGTDFSPVSTSIEAIRPFVLEVTIYVKEINV